MKRFYCSECNRVKRTQKWPFNITNQTSINVMDRVGSCNWHTSGVRIIRTEGQSYKRVKPVKVMQVSKRRKAS